MQQQRIREEKPKRRRRRDDDDMWKDLPLPTRRSRKALVLLDRLRAESDRIDRLLTA